MKLQTLANKVDNHLLFQVFWHETAQGTIEKDQVDSIAEQILRHTDLFDQYKSYSKENIDERVKEAEKLKKELEERTLKDRQGLEEGKGGVDESSVDNLVRYAKCLYESGQYEEAGNLCRGVLDEADSMDKPSIGLGALNADIMTGNWERVVNDIERVREAIQHPKIDHQDAFAIRRMLVYSSLFLLRDINSNHSLLDLLLTQEFINVITYSDLHVIKYISALSILTGRYERVLALVTAKSHQHQDSYSQFLTTLYEDIDTTKATSLIEDIREDAQKDFFLSLLADKISVEAGKAVIEVEGKVSGRIDPASLNPTLQKAFDVLVT